MRQFYDVEPINGFDAEIGSLLSALDDSTREWREELGEPPIEAITWQPTVGFHSIGGVLLHMVDTELYWFEEVAAGRPVSEQDAELLLSNQIEQYECKWPSCPREPIQWYYHLHDRMRARARQALAGLKPQETYKLKTSDVTLRWILAHVVEHDAYHGGQAVLLHELWKKQR